MVAEDVTDTLNLALQASGCDRATTNYTPRRLSSDDASNYVSADLAGSLDDQGSLLPTDPGQGRVLASDLEEMHPAGGLLSAGCAL
jgi:hypothetical protein